MSLPPLLLSQIEQIGKHIVATGITGVSAYKAGHIAEVCINEKQLQASSGWQDIGTLPTALLPVFRVDFAVPMINTDNEFALCIINETGRIMVFNPNNSGNYIRAELLYMTAYL